MQTAFVLIPTVLFFGIWKLKDIYAATAALMISVTILTIIEWVRTKKANKLHIISTLLLLVFGGTTLILKDPLFLQWKFTIYHWLIAAVLLWTHVAKPKPGIQSFFETMGNMTAGKNDEQLDFGSISAEKFRRANLISIIYFFMVGAVNLYIAYRMSEEAWVNFKVFGITITNMVFMGGLMGWLFASEFSRQAASEKNKDAEN